MTNAQKLVNGFQKRINNLADRLVARLGDTTHRGTGRIGIYISDKYVCVYANESVFGYRIKFSRYRNDRISIECDLLPYTTTSFLELFLREVEELVVSFENTEGELEIKTVFFLS